MFSFRRSSRNVSDTPTAGASGMLSDLSCNSPSGKIRLNKSKKDRGSPYAKGKGKAASRRSESLLGDDKSLLGDDGKCSTSFVADKHVILKKPADGSRVGVTFRAALEVGQDSGLVLTGVDAGSVAAASSLFVGDIIHTIDGVSVTTAEEGLEAITAVRPGASIFIAALGGTREVVIDKRLGDCGMTCAAVTHINRGVLLKRIAKGSLADAAKLYPGDTIVSVNGTLVNHHAEAVSAIDKVDTLVKLVVLGESQEMEIAPKTETNRTPLGMTIVNHDSPQDGAGVKILEVVADGRAAQAGLTAGDTLLSVNGVLCTDYMQAVEMLDQIATGEGYSEAVKPIKVVIQSKYSSIY